MKAYRCGELPKFKTKNLGVVKRAFEKATRISMWQGWLPKEEKAFMSAEVFIGWRDEALLVFAEMTDADIFTRARKPNQKMWELGDVFEMFLSVAGEPTYFEFHVTPNNQWLQLRFADSSVVDKLRKTGDMTPCVIRKKVFRSEVWRRPKEKKWFVYAEIPAKIICETKDARKRGTWNFSFSRYDYTRRPKLRVISSTSPHMKPNFHARKEWGKMKFYMQDGKAARFF
jgi:hypothetical protein